MLVQKLYKNGNSVAMTISKEILEELKLKEGSEVMVTVDPEDKKVTVQKVEQQTQAVPNLTPEFKEWLDRVSTKYQDLIHDLAKK